KRGAAPLVRLLTAIVLRQRENEYQKSLELERQPQITFRGPTLLTIQAADNPHEEGLLFLPLNRFVIKKVTTYWE
ncbi:hypothetical protein CJZ35_25035, partial [Salmonella enterica subsp. enterica serovar Braenderup]|uniref:hypothetical protein n=1 Tax=Salmonella enterica TaxID=28901 RepID=UPI000BDB8E15